MKKLLLLTFVIILLAALQAKPLPTAGHFADTKKFFNKKGQFFFMKYYFDWEVLKGHEKKYQRMNKSKLFKDMRSHVGLSMLLIASQMPCTFPNKGLRKYWKEVNNNLRKEFKRKGFWVKISRIDHQQQDLCKKEKYTTEKL